MSTFRKLSLFRRLAVVATLALVAVACTRPTTETTSEVTTATTTTITPRAEEVTYSIGILGDLTTDNFWAYLGPEWSDVNNGYVLGKSHLALFTVAHPNNLLVPQLAEGAPNQAVREGDVWVVEQTIRQGVKWSDGEEVTANDLVFAYEVVKEHGLGEEMTNRRAPRWSTYFPLQTDAVEDDLTDAARKAVAAAA